jgi:hypothetical protein
MHTEIESEAGSKEIKVNLDVGPKDDSVIIKVLREINDDFHDADKINIALDSTILYKLVE